MFTCTDSRSVKDCPLNRMSLSVTFHIIMQFKRGEVSIISYFVLLPPCCCFSFVSCLSFTCLFSCFSLILYFVFLLTFIVKLSVT